jgi:hypothetical protein
VPIARLAQLFAKSCERWGGSVLYLIKSPPGGPSFMDGSITLILGCPALSRSVCERVGASNTTSLKGLLYQRRTNRFLVSQFGKQFAARLFLLDLIPLFLII